jgi:prevent-host-death family protein
MPRNTSLADMKAHFSEWVRAAEAGDAVVITRHGKAVVALVPAADVEQLARLRAAGPEQGLAGLAGGWEGSEDLVEQLAKMRRTPPRRSPRLR